MTLKGSGSQDGCQAKIVAIILRVNHIEVTFNHLEFVFLACRAATLRTL